MTNWTIARDMTDEERAEELPCFVHHADAGGQCRELAKKVVYGLNFCAAHGAELEAGAMLEAYANAGYYFDRLRNPHVPSFNMLVDAELEAVAERLNRSTFDDAAYRAALMRAYPEIPEDERARLDSWKRDEASYPGNAEDALLDSLATLHKLMRLAYEDGETWIVELLEHERESVAAEAAYAMRELSPQS